MNINGLIRVLTESTEGYFYTTEEMLKDNILIEEVNIENGNGEIMTDLNLYYYDDLDAKSFQLGSTNFPIPLNMFLMVKEIVTLHESHPLPEFLNIINELSVGSMFESYQSKEENKSEVRNWIKGYFEEFKSIKKVSLT